MPLAGWQDGRMLTIFKSVTSTTFQLSNFYNEQWDTTELMNLGQSRGIIIWAYYFHLQVIVLGSLKFNIILVFWKWISSTQEHHLILKSIFGLFGSLKINKISVFWKWSSSSQDDNYGCNTRGTIFTVVNSTHQGIVRIVSQFILPIFLFQCYFVVMIGTKNAVNIFL